MLATITTLLTSLTDFSLHHWVLPVNHRKLAAQLIRTTIISTKCWSEKKTITIPIIRILSPDKDHHAAVKQWPTPPITVMKSSCIFLVPGDAKMGQQIISINKSGPQDIVFIKKDWFKYTHKKSCVIYSSHNSLYHSGEEHPPTSAVGVLLKKIEKTDYSHRNTQGLFSQEFWLCRELCHKKKLLSQIDRSNKSCYIQYLPSNKKRGENNTTGNKTMALNKYMTDPQIVQFNISNKTRRRIFFG